jgi:hypothetical protein
VLAALDSVGVGVFRRRPGTRCCDSTSTVTGRHCSLTWVSTRCRSTPRTGPPLATWTTDALADVDQDAHVRAVIANVSRRCIGRVAGKVCTEFAAAPILSAGRVAGAVVLGSSPADVVNLFPNVSGGADLGVLIPTGQPLGLPADESFCRGGFAGDRVERKGKYRPLLQSTRGDSSDPPLVISAYASLSYDGGQFELSFLALDTPLDASSPAIMVVIDDLTQALDDIRKSVWNRLQGELLASLLSLLLLALLVHAPLQRMTRAVRAIPLLGRRAFAEARARIAPRARRLVDDEIDSLDEAAIALSYRLETLENEVAAHSAETQGMLQRISVERDFSKSLLDTAQVIILTQSADGRILT